MRKSIDFGLDKLDFGFDAGFGRDIGFGFRADAQEGGNAQERRERANAKRLKLRGSGLDNMFDMDPESADEWGIPRTEPFTGDLDGVEWASFNQKEKIIDLSNIGVHHYIEDYQFTVHWTKPDKYLPLFRQCRAVVSVDYSNFQDMPKAQQLWNHYRRQWLAKYWQQRGVSIVSSLSWAQGQIFEWSFAGIPQGTACATSFVCDRLDKGKALDELLLVIDALKPTKLLIKANDTDADFLSKHVDFDQIKPYNWRR